MSSSSHPPISYPKAVEIPSSARHSSQRHKPQKSSLSGTMSWLSRSSSSNSSLNSPKQPYSASKPMRISEPKFVDLFTPPTVNKNPGSGATVVRTPQDALAGSGLHNPDVGRKETRSMKAEIVERSPHPSPPASPSRPTIQITRSQPNLTLREIPQSPRQPVPQRPPPVPIQVQTPEPAVVVYPPSQPSFEPILITPVPVTPIDPYKTIVTIETCTTTYKTTLNTLTSRQSHLSDYFVSLLESTQAMRSDACSVYSDSSDIQDNLNNSIFHNHVAASGLLAPSHNIVHIFLDRPSAPYTHILSYLRTPPSPDRAPTLPRAVQLAGGTFPTRIEALLELRDEANFLQLEELYALCVDELSSHRQKHIPAPIAVRPHGQSTHGRGPSGSSSGSHILDGIEERLEDADGYNAILHRFPTPPNSSAPSSRTGSGHESALGSFPHRPPPVEVRKEGYTTLKSRPPPSDWI